MTVDEERSGGAGGPSAGDCTAQEWLVRFAAALSVAPPTEEEQEALLALAAEAAHRSQRLAAPLACWLCGRSGLDPREALAIAAALRCR